MGALAALPAELVAELLPLLLAYLRIQAAVLVMPVFSERVLSARVRVALAMALTPAAAAFGPPLPDPAPDIFVILALREMLVGLLIAMPVRIMSTALNVASSAIGATASLSQLIGTGTEAAPHPIGNLLHAAGLALLMAMGLPMLLIDLIAQSYAAFPAGRLAIGGDQVAAMIGLVMRAFLLAMALASPFILGGLMYQLLLGVVNKVMPQLPVVFIGAPAIIFVALVGLAILSPGIIGIWADAVLGTSLETGPAPDTGPAP
ncbi:MAG: flagellar biosynthetic protein FliR [Paracoccus sp. (in: a-proteobacteria)]|nr:flagellar biosynthetic protein FliR [Paracoccus sp. (in: a-proteobacteria)]